MIQELKDKFPEWCNDTQDKGKYALMLTNDIDSLFSCKILEEKFEYKINWFYDFQGLYRLEKTDKPGIAVDCDLSGEQRCWANHCCLLSNYDAPNPNCANLNIAEGISNSNYYEKPCISTILTILSYYDFDIMKLDDEQLKIVTFIDGIYTPFRIFKKNFKVAQKPYYDKLEYGELYKWLEKEVNKNGFSEFERIRNEYGFNSKKQIWIDEDGQLKTSINIEKLSQVFGGFDFSLPKGEFTKIKSFDTYNVQTDKNSKHQLPHAENGIFSLAVTRKNFVSYSVKN